MINWSQVYQEREKRAAIIQKAVSLKQAASSGALDLFCDITVTEALVLGLLNQQVRKYIGIFGHGTTDLGEVLRTYQQAGLVQVYQVCRHHSISQTQDTKSTLLRKSLQLVELWLYWTRYFLKMTVQFASLDQRW